MNRIDCRSIAGVLACDINFLGRLECEPSVMVEEGSTPNTALISITASGVYPAYHLCIAAKKLRSEIIMDSIVYGYLAYGRRLEQ
jgi:hypothetical protein